jgi:hypothetical protein
VIPYRKPQDGSPLPQWKEDLNATHRSVRARIEHTRTRMKEHKILRDYRRAAHTLADTAADMAEGCQLVVAGFPAAKGPSSARSAA